MRKPIAALFSPVVMLIGQSAEATEYQIYNKFEAHCRFNTLVGCSNHTLLSPDLVHAEAGVDRSTDEPALRSPQAAQRKNK